MDGVEPSLLPYDADERSAIGGYRPGAGQRKRDPRTFMARVRGHLSSARVRLKRVRVAARRQSFEAGAALRSSAALAGLSRDARTLKADARKAGAKVRTEVRGRLPKDSATAAGLRKDLGRMRLGLQRSGDRFEAGMEAAANRLERGGKRVKHALLRSAFVSGLAIDSRRVAKRVRHPRRGHGPGSAH